MFLPKQIDLLHNCVQFNYIKNYIGKKERKSADEHHNKIQMQLVLT